MPQRRCGGGGAHGDGNGSAPDKNDGEAQGASPSELDAITGRPMSDAGEGLPEEQVQKSFFEFPGPLYGVAISPASSTIGVGESRKLRAIARDKSRRPIDSGVVLAWSVAEGASTVEPSVGEFVQYRATKEPEVARLSVKATSGEITCESEAVVTVTAELIPRREGDDVPFKHGLPGYTYERAPGALWRSHYRVEQSLITINNAHADFIFASRSESAKLRYIARLYAKEIVLANFPGAPREELLERMVELTLYMEENLR